MLICNDFANDLTDGIASPAFNSPLIIAALICDAICSYKGRLALLLTTISKFPPPFCSLVLCRYKYSIKQESTDVNRVNYKKQTKCLCSVCFLQFIWAWNSVWLSFKFCVTLWHMSIRGRVVLAVTFQKVDAAPYAQAAAQGDDQSLQNVDSIGKKAHIHISFRSVELLG